MLRDRSGAPVDAVTEERLRTVEAAMARQLASAAPQQRAVFDLIVRVVERRYGRPALIHVFGGAMFTFDDRGALYEGLLSAAAGRSYRRLTRKRQSSHYNEDAGYLIRSELVDEHAGVRCQQGFDFPRGCLLFGIVPPRRDGTEPGGASFFQTEGASLTLASLPAHTLHYVQHVVLRVNRGMMGWSPHSEKWGREIRDIDNPER